MCLELRLLSILWHYKPWEKGLNTLDSLWKSGHSAASHVHSHGIHSACWNVTGQKRCTTDRADRFTGPEIIVPRERVMLGDDGLMCSDTASGCWFFFLSMCNKAPLVTLLSASPLATTHFIVNPTLVLFSTWWHCTAVFSLWLNKVTWSLIYSFVK